MRGNFAVNKIIKDILYILKNSFVKLTGLAISTTCKCRQTQKGNAYKGVALMTLPINSLGQKTLNIAT